MSYAVPLMETIRARVDQELAASAQGRALGFLKKWLDFPPFKAALHRQDAAPRPLDPRIIANRDIHLRGQAAYMGEAVPELAHAKTRSEQAGCP